MSTITLVTGNAGKLKEWQRLIPSDVALQAADIDLEEIQSLDLVAIIKDKARRAYEAVGSPVIVEDVSAGLDELHGLPGPFIKYFELELGQDALHQLASTDASPALVSALTCYYDGKQFITARGDVAGLVVPPRGDHLFGFDICFQPEGQTKTYGEMEPHEKDIVSHRSKAIKELVKQLQTSGVI